jgi:twitching motility protein PilT
MDIDKLLQQAIELGASDLHLSGDNPPIVRIDGDIQRLDAPPVAGAEIGTILAGLLAEPQRAQLEADLELDLALEHRSGVRFRVNAFTNRAGPAAVFRVIPQSIPALPELGAPPAVERVTALQKGLVLVTGPTGSGKSTTLAALIDHINTTVARHILTIEDPIEFTHRSKRSLINQREIGRDSRSFARALRSALREDPDVILVGELRDLETISLALTAAETGHLVLGTLHTTSAAKTIDRLIDVFSSADKAMVRTMLSGSLRAVIAQTLLRRRDGAGRVAAFEILIGTPAVANLIRENQISQINAMMQTGARYGMQLMTDAIQQLVATGLIDAAEAVRGSAAWTGEGQSSRSSLALDLASAAGVGPDKRPGPRVAAAAEPDYAL